MFRLLSADFQNPITGLITKSGQGIRVQIRTDKPLRNFEAGFWRPSDDTIPRIS